MASMRALVDDVLLDFKRQDASGSMPAQSSKRGFFSKGGLCKCDDKSRLQLNTMTLLIVAGQLHCFSVRSRIKAGQGPRGAQVHVAYFKRLFLHGQNVSFFHILLPFVAISVWLLLCSFFSSFLCLRKGQVSPTAQLATVAGSP